MKLDGLIRLQVKRNEQGPDSSTESPNLVNRRTDELVQFAEEARILRQGCSISSSLTNPGHELDTVYSDKPTIDGQHKPVLTTLARAKPDDQPLNITRLTLRHRVRVGSFTSVGTTCGGKMMQAFSLVWLCKPFLLVKGRCFSAIRTTHLRKG